MNLGPLRRDGLTRTGLDRFRCLGWTQAPPVLFVFCPAAWRARVCVFERLVFRVMKVSVTPGTASQPTRESIEKAEKWLVVCTSPLFLPSLSENFGSSPTYMLRRYHTLLSFSTLPPRCLVSRIWPRGGYACRRFGCSSSTKSPPNCFSERAADGGRGGLWLHPPSLGAQWLAPEGDNLAGALNAPDGARQRGRPARARGSQAPELHHCNEYTSWLPLGWSTSASLSFWVCRILRVDQSIHRMMCFHPQNRASVLGDSTRARAWSFPVAPLCLEAGQNSGEQVLVLFLQPSKCHGVGPGARFPRTTLVYFAPSKDLVLQAPRLASPRLASPRVDQIDVANPGQAVSRRRRTFGLLESSPALVKDAGDSLLVPLRDQPLVW